MAEDKNNVIDPVTNIVTVVPDEVTTSDDLSVAPADDAPVVSETLNRIPAVKLSYETQGMLAYQNWLSTHENESRYLTGKRKRAIRRDFIRQAKKGIYEHVFNVTGQINGHDAEAGKETEKTENVG